MAPFRPSNINKRIYPGNANVVGPTISSTCTTSQSTLQSCTPSIAACIGPQNLLGCRYTYCYCPCCQFVCECTQTLCTRTIPSGMWSANEVNEARSRDAWGPNTCSCDAASCICNIQPGGVCLSSACTDCCGFFVCCGPTTNKWFVAPSSTETCETFKNPCNGAFGGPAAEGAYYAPWCARANACNNFGNCNWFIPNSGQLICAGYCCRTYWDCYSPTMYWSSSFTFVGFRAFGLHFITGTSSYHNSTGACRCTRAFRCVAS